MWRGLFIKVVAISLEQSPELQQIVKALSASQNLPDKDRLELLELVANLGEAAILDRARHNFLDFVKRVWPIFIESAHHRKVAELFDDVIEGRKKRVIINMAPRHTKSEFASWLLPAYTLGRAPSKKIIQASHTADLAVDFGRKVRNLVNSEEYHEVFPGTELSADSKSAGRWKTNHAGEYYAVGVGGALAGRGADLLVIDDPHSEQDAMSPSLLESAYDWYMTGPRQRLQPGGSIILVQTRWDERDLTGRILKESIKSSGGDEWEVFELPAILDENTEKERPIWPSFWSLDELKATRASISPQRWQAQYQQQPTSEEGALIKREWWRMWEQKAPPRCSYILQSWDTAFLKSQTADFSALTTWGVFNYEDPETGKLLPNIILLDAEQDRWEFPELKEKALQEYNQWNPDSVIIESKAAGLPLIAELRRTGVPVAEFSPSRGNDKVARVNSVSDIFYSQRVWAPEGRRFAQDVINQCAAFPHGEHDDYVDSTTQAIMRFRQGGLIALENDWADEETVRHRKTRAYY